MTNDETITEAGNQVRTYEFDADALKATTITLGATGGAREVMSAAEDRAAVVAFLRKWAKDAEESGDTDWTPATHFRQAAGCIEEGQHHDS